MAGERLAFPTEDVLRSLPTQAYLMVVAVSPTWNEFFAPPLRNADQEHLSDAEYDLWLKWGGLAKAILDEWRDERPCDFAAPGPDRYGNVRTLINMWENMIKSAQNMKMRNESQATATEYAEHFAAILGTGFCYGLPEDALASIRAQANTLAQMIQAADGLDGWLKKRLLRRVAQLQKDLQARMSNLDVVFGVWAEVNVLLKGTDEATRNIQKTAIALGKLVLASAIVIKGGEAAHRMLQDSARLLESGQTQEAPDEDTSLPSLDTRGAPRLILAEKPTRSAN